jgi:NitT/TauT family transport system permease protein
MTDDSAKRTTQLPLWGITPATRVPSLLWDLPVILAGLALFYAALSLTHYWLTPFRGSTEISLEPSALPKYAMFSVLRIAIAYGFSLAFSVIYGYVAAYNPKAERIMIPLLDTLQSIPVLSFLPGVMLAMVALFPTK